MPVQDLSYRVRIRNRDDTADLLVASSIRGDATPFIAEAPSGDGQSLDPVTGAPTTGTYTVRLIDALLEDGSRFVTRSLADERARQQYLSLRAYVDVSSNLGGSWTISIPGYVNALRKISGIEYDLEIGDTRRREVSRTIFGQASGEFSNVTTVMGGPVLEDFAGLLTNHGGWKFKVSELDSSPNIVKLLLELGFDPRKSPDTTFTSMSTAIRNYTVDWARGYFQEATTWLTHNIRGNFPQLRFRLVPVGGGDPMFFVPLALDAALVGPWWNPTGGEGDAITSGGTSKIIVPADGYDIDGNPITFAPAVNDEFYVWLYAIPVSEQNPLHIFERPVDLWKKIRLANGYVAGVDFDDSNLADITAAINADFGGDVFLALRLTSGSLFGEFERNNIFGAFRLSTRVVNGLVQLYRFAVRGTPTPTEVIDITDLESQGKEGPPGTVWEIEEKSIITAVVLKQLRLFPWSSDDTKQPDSDSLIARPWPVSRIENSNDDIPAGLENGGHEVTIGNISGTITFDDGEPVPFENYLRLIADEMFQIFGRGAPQGEIYCLPTVSAKVGEQVLVNLPHRPNAVLGRTPTSDNGGERRCLVISRTERPQGPQIEALDVALEIGGGPDTGVGGGSEEVTDVTTVTPDAPILFPSAYGTALANWSDAYPQFSTRIQFEAHAPGDTTFDLLYGGEHLVIPGVFSDSQAGIGVGWIVRARIQLTDNISNSSFSAYSNEIEITGSTPSVPTDEPIDLVADSTIADEADSTWTNTDGGVYQLRIQWQGSLEPTTPTVWNNIAGGTRILPAGTTSDNQPTGAATFARFRLSYINSAGQVGPTVTSDPVAIAT